MMENCQLCLSTRGYSRTQFFSDQFMDVSKSPHLWNDKPIYNLTKLANGFTCRTCGRSIKCVCKSLHVHICSWFMDHYYGTPGIWIHILVLKLTTPVDHCSRVTHELETGYSYMLRVDIQLQNQCKYPVLGWYVKESCFFIVMFKAVFASFADTNDL